MSEEIVLGRFGDLDEEAAATQAVRTALAILDEAVTVAPIQGIHKVKIKQANGRRHLAIYFAGPMRAAGGTEMGLTLIVGDHIRHKLNIPPYKATEQTGSSTGTVTTLCGRLCSSFLWSRMVSRRTR